MNLLILDSLSRLFQIVKFKLQTYKKTNYLLQFFKLMEI